MTVTFLKSEGHWSINSRSLWFRTRVHRSQVTDTVTSAPSSEAAFPESWSRAHLTSSPEFTKHGCRCLWLKCVPLKQSVQVCVLQPEPGSIRKVVLSYTPLNKRAPHPTVCGMVHKCVMAPVTWKLWWQWQPLTQGSSPWAASLFVAALFLNFLNLCFNQRKTAAQCGVGFCHLRTRISHNDAHSPSFLSLSPPRLHPSGSSQSTRLGSQGYIAASHQLSILHVVVCRCQSFFLFSAHSLLLPLCPQVCSLHLVSPLLPCKQVRQYQFSSFHISTQQTVYLWPPGTWGCHKHPSLSLWPHWTKHSGI